MIIMKIFLPVISQLKGSRTRLTPKMKDVNEQLKEKINEEL